MASTFDAVGPSSSGAGTTTIGASPASPAGGTWTHTPAGTPTMALVWVALGQNDNTDNTKTLSVTYGGVTMLSVGKHHSGSDADLAGFGELFALGNPPTGAQSVVVTITYTSTVPTSIEAGSITVVGSTTSTAALIVSHGEAKNANPTLTTAGSAASSLMAGFCANGATLSAATGGTSRFINTQTGANSAVSAAAQTAAGTGSGVTMGWTGGSDWYAEMIVEIPAAAEIGPAWSFEPPPALRIPANAEKWLNTWIVGSTMQVSAQTGSASVVLTANGTQQHQADSLPWLFEPPSAMIYNPANGEEWTRWWNGGEAFKVAAQTGSASVVVTGTSTELSKSCIVGLGGGSTSYFVDQSGNPRMVIGDEAWALPFNAGRWAGTWQSDIDAYMASRSSQGFTVIYCKPLGSTNFGGAFQNGRTWDGVIPWNINGDPSSGLNNTFWTRIDYLLAKAASVGITVFLNFAVNDDTGANGGGGALDGKTSQQWQDYGANMGARYKNAQNLVWVVGDDEFGSLDTQWAALLTGLRSSGDTHIFTGQNQSYTTSRQDLSTGGAMTFGAANAQYNAVYDYQVAYRGVEEAYKEAGPITVIHQDGHFFQNATSERLDRNHLWWALSSGARGYIVGSEGIWLWATGSAASVTSETWMTTVPGVARTVVEGLTGWHTLLPDTTNKLVTGGRGTRASFTGTEYSGTTDAYVSASRTPDGRLALIYLSHGTTITIDQSYMVAGYTATWVDPLTGATSAATPGATYNSTAKGNNSAGDPDWVLVLQATTDSNTWTSMGWTFEPPPALRVPSNAEEWNSWFVGGQQAIPANPETGNAPVVLVGAGTAVKVAAQTGNAAVVLAGNGTEVRVAPEVGNAAVVLAGNSAEYKTEGGVWIFEPPPAMVANPANAEEWTVWFTGPAQALQGTLEAGNTPVILSANAAVKKIAVQNGSAAVVLAAGGTEVRKAPEVGNAPVVLAGSGTEVRKAPEVGTATVVLVGTGTEAQFTTPAPTWTFEPPPAMVANPANAEEWTVWFTGPAQALQGTLESGSTPVILSANAAVKKTAVQGGVSSVVVSGSGTSRKVAGSSGSSPVVISSSALERKRQAQQSVCTVVTTGTGAAKHIAPRAGRSALVAVGVVLPFIEHKPQVGRALLLALPRHHYNPLVPYVPDDLVPYVPVARVPYQP